MEGSVAGIVEGPTYFGLTKNSSHDDTGDPVSVNAANPQTLTVQSNSATNDTWTFQQDFSPTQLIDGCVMLEYEMTVFVDAIAKDHEEKPFGTAGQLNLQDVDAIPSQFPAHRICSTMNLTLNNISQGYNVSDFVNPITHYTDLSEFDNESFCPCQPDVCQNVTRNVHLGTDSNFDHVGRSRTPAYYMSKANFRADDNEAAELVSMKSGEEITKSGRSFCLISSENVDTYEHPTGTQTTNQKKMRFKIREPLLHPFLKLSGEDSYMSRVSNFMLTMQFRNAKDALCQVAGVKTMVLYGSKAVPRYIDMPAENMNPAAHLSGAFYRVNHVGFGNVKYEGGKFTDDNSITPKLHFRIATPTVPVQPQVSLPVSDIVTYTYKQDSSTNFGPVSNPFAESKTYYVEDSTAVDSHQISGKSDTIDFKTGNIVLARIPQRIFVLVVPKDDPNALRADAYGIITSLKVRTLDNSGLYVGQDTLDLYQGTKRIGNKQTYQQFADSQGSVMCIDIAHGDLGPYPANTNARFQLEIECSAINGTRAISTMYDENLSYEKGFVLTSKDNHTPKPIATTYRGQWELRIIAQYGGSLTMDGTVSRTSYGVSEMVIGQALQSQLPAPVKEELAHGSGLYGGGFGSKLKKAWRKLKHSKAFHSISSAAKGAAKTAAKEVGEVALKSLLGRGSASGVAGSGLALGGGLALRG